MKKIMKKLTKAVLALACLPVTGLTVSAVDVPYYWGNTTWEVFDGLEPVNDRGWAKVAAKGEGFGDTDALIYVDDSFVGYNVYLVLPRKNTIQLELREDVDADAAVAEIAEVLDGYFPGLADSLNTEYYENFNSRHYRIEQENSFVQLWQNDLFDRNSNTMYGGRTVQLQMSSSVIPAELESELLMTLAKRHLICAYYGWGETASYMSGSTPRLDLYSVKYMSPIAGEVQTYLDAHHPGYRAELYQPNEYSDATYYRIVPDVELTLREQTELAFEIWEQFGMGPGIMILESGAETTRGHNALESPGDVTLDCELNLLDAITLNKNLLGVEKLPDTAVKNADVNGDGTPDSADSLAILRELVGLTTDFQ